MFEALFAAGGVAYLKERGIPISLYNMKGGSAGRKDVCINHLTKMIEDSMVKWHADSARGAVAGFRKLGYTANYCVYDRGIALAFFPGPPHIVGRRA